MNTEKIDKQDRYTISDDHLKVCMQGYVHLE